jgi:hypothetical protein
MISGSLRFSLNPATPYFHYYRAVQNVQAVAGVVTWVDLIVLIVKGFPSGESRKSAYNSYQISY